jgi:hypothetical protein
MQTHQLPEVVQSSCNKVFMFSIVITLIAISLHLKQYKRLTFEMSVFILNGLCLAFIMWSTGNTKVQDILVALALSGMPCLLILWKVNPRNQRLKHLRNREDVPMDAIYSRFFSEANLPKDLVLELWNEVATLLRVPPGKLRPSDRFDKELAPGGVWLRLDDDAAEVNLAAQCRLKKRGVKMDFSTIQTLRDYIELFCKTDSAK